MKQIIKYIGILLSAVRGYLLCVSYLIFPIRNVRCGDMKSGITVSLTSYGRRVSNTLKYPLLSMLHQTRIPDRVVVWLDNDHFSIDNIPGFLKKMIEINGIDVRFCEDLRSYKKLVPSLLSYPDEVIVTIDDDVVYEKKFIEHLYKKHTEHPNDIICTRAHALMFDSVGLLPYNQWMLNQKQTDDKLRPLLLPLGCSGILYPPHSLHEDVTDKSLYMTLAPNADDVWFWFMGLMNRRRVYLTNTNSYMPIDLVYQFFHKDASLMQENLKENKNDIQIRAVLHHYGLLYDKESLEAMLP